MGGVPGLVRKVVSGALVPSVPRPQHSSCVSKKYWWGLGRAGVQSTRARKGPKRAPDVGERVQRTPWKVPAPTVHARVTVGVTGSIAWCTFAEGSYAARLTRKE